MNTKDVLHYSEVRRLRKTINEDVLPRISDSSNIYISEHFAERLFQRRMVADAKLISSIIIHFMNEVFDKTTFMSRRYKIGVKNLKVGIDVAFSIKHNKRLAFVKTAYDVDNEYEFDEIIELKVNV